MVEALVFAEKVIHGDAGVVAERGIDTGEDIEIVVFAGVGRCDGAKAAQGGGNRWTGGKGLAEELAVVIEKWVGVDVVGREHLTHGPLKTIFREILTNVRLRNAQLEVAPGSGSGHNRARPQSGL